MERSCRQLVLFFLFLAASSSATVLEPGTSQYCAPSWLADMAPDCVGGLEKPRLPCCMMVMATVGMGFDDEGALYLPRGERARLPCHGA